MMEGASVHFAKAFESIGIEDTSDLTKANKVTLNALKEDGKRAAGKLFQLGSSISSPIVHSVPLFG